MCHCRLCLARHEIGNRTRRLVHSAGDKVFALFDAGLEFGQRCLNHLLLIRCQLSKTQILLQPVFLSIASPLHREQGEKRRQGISHQAEQRNVRQWHEQQKHGKKMRRPWIINACICQHLDSAAAPVSSLTLCANADNYYTRRCRQKIHLRPNEAELQSTLPPSGQI